MDPNSGNRDDLDDSAKAGKTVAPQVHYPDLVAPACAWLCQFYASVADFDLLENSTDRSVLHGTAVPCIIAVGRKSGGKTSLLNCLFNTNIFSAVTGAVLQVRLRYGLPVVENQVRISISHVASGNVEETHLVSRSEVHETIAACCSSIRASMGGGGADDEPAPKPVCLERIVSVELTDVSLPNLDIIDTPGQPLDAHHDDVAGVRELLQGVLKSLGPQTLILRLYGSDHDVEKQIEELVPIDPSKCLGVLAQSDTWSSLSDLRNLLFSNHYGDLPLPAHGLYVTSIKTTNTTDQLCSVIKTIEAQEAKFFSSKDAASLNKSFVGVPSLRAKLSEVYTSMVTKATVPALDKAMTAHESRLIQDLQSHGIPFCMTDKALLESPSVARHVVAKEELRDVVVQALKEALEGVQARFIKHISESVLMPLSADLERVLSEKLVGTSDSVNKILEREVVDASAVCARHIQSAVEASKEFMTKELSADNVRKSFCLSRFRGVLDAVVASFVALVSRWGAAATERAKTSIKERVLNQSSWKVSASFQDTGVQFIVNMPTSFTVGFVLFSVTQGVDEFVERLIASLPTIIADCAKHSAGFVDSFDEDRIYAARALIEFEKLRSKIFEPLQVLKNDRDVESLYTNSRMRCADALEKLSFQALMSNHLAEAYYAIVLAKTFSDEPQARTFAGRSAAWLTRESGKGNQFAQYALAFLREIQLIDPKDGRSGVVQLYLSSFNQRNFWAANNLGAAYEHGKGVDKDLKEALKMYKVGAEGGNPLAQENYARCMEGSAKPQEVISWYEKSAALGNPAAMNALAFFYEKGHLVEKDEAKAVHYYEQAANRGHAISQRNLGVCYARGVGVKEDQAMAAEMYRRAANQNYPPALTSLAICYEQGIGVPKSEAEAFKLYVKAANLGYAAGQLNAGACYESGKGTDTNYKEAFRMYSLCAEQGDPAGQNALGLCFEYGVGTRKDLQKAVHWYTLAADAGNHFACRNLGLCLEMGKGVEVNTDEAMRYYTIAAEKGNVFAAYALGQIYENGTYGENNLNLPLAFKMYQLAAERGYVQAKHSLGHCYQFGIGCPVTPELAFQMFRGAVEGGHAPALCDLAACHENGFGTPTNIPEAIRLYSEASKVFPSAKAHLARLH